MVISKRTGKCRTYSPPPGMNRMVPPSAIDMLSLTEATSNAACATTSGAARISAAASPEPDPALSREP